MKKKNNVFINEPKDIDSFVRKKKKELKRKWKQNKIIWIVISILVALANISIIIISSITLKKVLDDYEANKSVGKTIAILAGGVSFVSILTFILSLIISIYRGYMKSNIYKEAKESIQYEWIKYNSKSNKLNEKQFRSIIDSIERKTRKKKKGDSFKKILVSILTGGSDE
ncbi:MAG: hypothetical protein NC236_00345 [Mycoplasma sp.]|nr:hypothetical protein [Mycoplasma sp.]